MKNLFLQLSLATCLTYLFASFAQAGNLVIIGGHFEQSDAAIYKEIIKLAPNSNPKACIWLTGAGEPDESYLVYSQAFHAYGASSIPIPISSFKPAWKDNQDDKGVADLIRTCDINFFTGGDQTRTTDLLYNKDGSDSLALQALRQNLNNGSVVAGSSAGNMMQSTPMITG